MTSRPMFTPLASADIEIAFNWYEEQRFGLGVQFSDALEALWDLLDGFPMPARKCMQDFDVS